MAKKEQNKKPSSGSISGIIREGHKIGEGAKAYQPTVDRTTNPPKGSSKDKK